MRIRIDKADQVFSEYIRRRDNRCVRCGKYQGEWKRLQCSHFFGRRKESVRFDPQNADGLCAGCHIYFGSNPESCRAFKLAQLGEDAYNALCVRANTPARKDCKLALIKARALLDSLEGEA